MSALRVGIVGLGAIARFYLAALDRVPGVCLVAACDPEPRALAPVRDRAACFPDITEMLAAGGIDADE